MTELSVRRWNLNGGDRRRAPLPNGPEAEIVIGPDDGWPAGLVSVIVPAGGAMGEHTHGESETMLIPQSGHLRLVDLDEDRVLELQPGSLATIPVGQRVRLENPAETEARALVVLTPPDFAAQLADWPTV